MPSSPPYKSNKNQIKKDSIKQRLESAIAAGEMPPFCTNCGAIETPTWRKIWVQEHDGAPESVEYSEKPGRVTAIEILKRDKDKNPLSHRLIKKALGFGDDRNDWSEKLLCNPCAMQNVFHLLAADGRHTKNMSQSVPGSSHSRASRGTGTADSPIEMDLDDELGSTRRLLFPSPRKEGTPKTLGEIDANVTKAADCRQNKEICGKENAVCDAQSEDLIMDDDIEALFNSPVHEEYDVAEKCLF
ncbi:hypothetical protein FVEG_16263 [Fusarium verticillioides 7600]|uniref:GATA-type domain-containing protein n=1 Tax=Gibberella moniliformis (strain M3125 / FGSC 7600) TaxID=334819 RepID=W7MBF4_GIBM7|nr:hypothetical protein FVEG_16263 [Fusarium verticillioides 7600]EWG48361.1 hypothetical protein FVEG_16263 [Fusarium verticillioides 7600]